MAELRCPVRCPDCDGELEMIFATPVVICVSCDKTWELEIAEEVA